jgi:hypothetical protein
MVCASVGRLVVLESGKPALERRLIREAPTQREA